MKREEIRKRPEGERGRTKRGRERARGSERERGKARESERKRERAKEARARRENVAATHDKGPR